MTTWDFEIRNFEGILLLVLGGILAIFRRWIKPFWRRLIVSQGLSNHTKLKELREKKELTDAEKDEYIDIVEDILKF